LIFKGDLKMALTFRELVACTGGETSYTGDDFSLSNVKFDSRDDMKGAAFIAFITEKNNGHKYISIAANKGALAAIVSEDFETSIPIIKVSDTLKAYQDIAAFYREKFSVPVIALTGSNGKTTVKDMLSTILSVKYKVLATEKNLNNEIGVPQTLLKFDNTYNAAVIEMGMNHHGEIRTLTNIAKPDIAIITKIGTAHMGNLGGTRKDVFNAKMEIAEGLKEGGTLLLCGDDDMLSEVELNEHEVVFCGLNNDGRNIIYASDIKQYWNNNGFGINFIVHYRGNAYSCALPVIGKHNAQNALLALTAGIKLNVNIEDAIEALRIYPRSSMRLETTSIHGIKFIKDYYNASPESTKAALNTLAELDIDGSRIIILGDLLELGEQSAQLHREIAEYSLNIADKVYYIGDYCDAFLSGRPDSLCFKSKDDLDFALSSAIINGDFSRGDIILIKGSNSTKMWEQYEFIRKLLERGNSMSAQTQLLVDVDALKHNYSAIKSYAGNNVQVMPVIKADAYGTGAGLLANIYSDCNFFAIADLIEADELHDIMPNARFLVLYQPFADEVSWIVERDYVTTSVCSVDFIQKLNQAAINAGKKITVHIEIDTGMSRLGVLVEDCGKFAEKISECKNLTVDGIFTHYSSADMYAPEDLDFTAEQTVKFKKAIEIMESIIGNIPYKHACASAAIFNPKAELFNMVRPGYILRGYYPCEEIKSKITLRPALKFVTQVAQIEEYEVGASVSYCRTFVAKRKTRLAQIPVGYDDGLMRRLSNKGAFVINGQLAPIVGNVTMDYTMVDVTDINPVVWVGDSVAIFDNVNMTIERMAELCDTIGYEIITNIKNKADRIECF
jgi:alanine racemase